MSNVETKKPKILQCKLFIIILSAIAFSMYSFGDLLLLINNLKSDHIGSLFVIFSNMANLVIPSLACILLAAYAIFLYEKVSARFVLPVIFLMLCNPVIDFLITELFPSLKYLDFDFDKLDDLIIDIFQMFSVVSIFLVLIIPLFVSAILALAGIKKRVIYVFSLAISFSYTIFMFMYFCINFLQQTFYRSTLDLEYLFKEIIFENLLYNLGTPLAILGMIALYLAVMSLIVENDSLFDKNEVSEQEVLEKKEITEKAKKLSTDVALTYLREKFENGELTEREYQTQRDLIIGKV